MVFLKSLCIVGSALLIRFSAECGSVVPDSGAAGIAAPDTAFHAASATVAAAPDTAAGHAPDGMHLFSRVGSDMLIQASAPFHMDAAQVLSAAAGIGITAGLIALDEPIDRKIRHAGEDHSMIGTTSRYVTELGGTGGIAAVAAYAGYSLIAGDKEAQCTSLLLAEALITSGLWVRMGKLAFGRERPSAAYEYSHLPGGRWHGLSGSLRKKSSEPISKYDAFPSGHTATAFAIATVFAKRSGESSYVPVISYTLAAIVGISRMIEHTHWASDVFAGACLGYLCAGQAVAQYEQQESAAAPARMQKPAIRVSAGILNDSPALHLTVAF
ncbi:MAG: phosphatase PAP2 family protein [Acidobacteriota bacterium]